MDKDCDNSGDQNASNEEKSDFGKADVEEGEMWETVEDNDEDEVRADENGMLLILVEFKLKLETKEAAETKSIEKMHRGMEFMVKVK